MYLKGADREYMVSGRKNSVRRWMFLWRRRSLGERLQTYTGFDATFVFVQDMLVFDSDSDCTRWFVLLFTLES